VSEKTRLAAEDPLTGLQNRRSFVELVAAEKSTGRPLTLVFIDLDRFKPLNDQYGHAVGDKVLTEIGRRLNEQPDILGAARLGGDEFAALFSAPAEADAADLQMLALHNSLTAPIQSVSGDVSVGASIGWVRAEGENTSVSDVLHSADVAMRRAKVEHLGVVEFDPVTDQAALASSAIEIALRHALAKGKIRPALQPIVSASNGDIVTMELLARWPGSGFLRDPAPQDFIPIAERLGLLNDMLWSTLHQALPALAGTSWSLAINVSPSQLTSRNFLRKLSGIIALHGSPPERIELEITEEVAFRNMMENCAVLEQARLQGFIVVLDDFGAGYSSLAMLDKLPLDKIKLDRAFVGELRDRAITQKILKATISLSRDLGISCTVEGIECAETASLVASFGCDQMQGYWIGMPELVEPHPQRLDLAS
jgi:diguanylate cyclase (GGDEF)-like protein